MCSIRIVWLVRLIFEFAFDFDMSEQFAVTFWSSSVCKNALLVCVIFTAFTFFLFVSVVQYSSNDFVAECVCSRCNLCMTQYCRNTVRYFSVSTTDVCYALCEFRMRFNSRHWHFMLIYLVFP